MVEKVHTVADLGILFVIVSRFSNEYRWLPKATMSRIGGQRHWGDISGH